MLSDAARPLPRTYARTTQRMRAARDESLRCCSSATARRGRDETRYEVRIRCAVMRSARERYECARFFMRAAAMACLPLPYARARYMRLSRLDALPLPRRVTTRAATGARAR